MRTKIALLVVLLLAIGVTPGCTRFQKQFEDMFGEEPIKEKPAIHNVKPYLITVKARSRDYKVKPNDFQELSQPCNTFVYIHWTDEEGDPDGDNFKLKCNGEVLKIK